MGKNRCLLLLCYLLTPLLLAAQTDVLQWQSLHPPIGLTGKTIRLVEQDKEGLLWLVAVDGLYRYDGQELLLFDLHTTPALPALPVTALCSDGHGNLWLGFHNGAVRFNLQKWTTEPLFASDWQMAQTQDKDISAMACTADGCVYFGSQSGKLYVVRPGTDNNGPKLAGENASVKPRMATGPQLRLLLDMSSSRKYGQFNAVMDIQQPASGQLWLATGSGMLVNLPVLKPGVSYGAPAYFKPKVAEGHSIANICYDSASGKCLFSAGALLCEADYRQIHAQRTTGKYASIESPWNDHVKLVRLPQGEPYNFYSPFYISGTHAAVLSDGALAPKNIYVYNFKAGIWKLITPNAPIDFPGKQINSIADKKTTTYVSSTGGLTKIQFHQSPVVPMFNVFDNNNSVRSVFRDSNSLYMGSYRDRFIRYNSITGEVKKLSEMYVYSMLRWGRDSLLITTEGNGLFWFIPSINKFTPIHLQANKALAPENSFKRTYLTMLCRVNKDQILVGSYHGIALVDPVSQRYFPIFMSALALTMQGLKTNAIIALHNNKVEENELFLVATNAGVFSVNTRSGQVASFLNGSEGDRAGQNKSQSQSGTGDAPEKNTAIYSLLKVKDQIWMGSDGHGVLVADTAGRILSSEWLNRQLTSPLVYSMASVGDYVLIGTAKGLNILRLTDSSLSRYTIYNGLAVDEFNQAAVFNNDSQVVFGTTNGLVNWNLNASGRQKDSSLFHVGINQLAVINKDNRQDISYNMSYLPREAQRILITSGAKYVTITFGSPDENDSQLDYYYRLKSTDPWIELGASRMITFVKIRPADYRLQFAAQSPDGGWMEDPDQILLIVKPAFYQTIVFKLLLGCLAAGIILLIVRIREMQLRKQRDFRMKIAGDLHDEIGSSLTRIWHQVQNYRLNQEADLKQPVAYTENEEIEEIEKIEATDLHKNGIDPLDFIAQTSQEAISMMSDMVWSIDAQFDTQQELTLRMKSYAYALQQETNIPIKVVWVANPAEEGKISQVIRQNLFLLFKEGVNNAVKHGDGKWIEIRLNFAGRIEMAIDNTFDPGGPGKVQNRIVIQGGSGIANMRRRAEKMKGSLTVTQKANVYQLRVHI